MKTGKWTFGSFVGLAGVVAIGGAIIYSLAMGDSLVWGMVGLVAGTLGYIMLVNR